MRLASGAIFLAAALAAQTLGVYSEFAAVTPSGEVAGQPREILSPQICRNGFTSFQVVVRTATRWTLYVGQNPEEAVRVTLYRERGARLEPVTLPVEGQGTQVFWMDLWADRDAPVRRIKVEPQLNVAGDWVSYPMEVRVMSATVPEGARAPGTAPPERLLANYLCGTPLERTGGGLSIAHLRNRNAQQDLALAVEVPRQELFRLVGGQQWCRTMAAPAAEWYLGVRDYLFRR